MTTGQSDKDSRKSEHETLQLRCLNDKPTNLRVQVRGDWRKRYRRVVTNPILLESDHKTLREPKKGDRGQETRIIEYSGAVQNEIVD